VRKGGRTGAVLVFDFQHKLLWGNFSRVVDESRVKKTSSPWRPLIGATVSITTINHYIPFALHLERTTTWVGGASSENWLISGTSCRSAFFSYPNLIFWGFCHWSAPNTNIRTSPSTIPSILVSPIAPCTYFATITCGGHIRGDLLLGREEVIVGVRKRRVHSQISVKLAVFKNYFLYYKTLFRYSNVRRTYNFWIYRPQKFRAHRKIAWIYSVISVFQKQSDYSVTGIAPK